MSIPESRDAGETGPSHGVARRTLQRQAMIEEIVAAARQLLTEPGGLSLRAVAQRMGVTAPALYRYVDDYQDLVRLVTQDIDRETAELLRDARDSWPADDLPGRLLAATFSFRRWALTHREEFALVFANPLATDEETSGWARGIPVEQCGLVFTDLLHDLWQERHFPIPSLDELDPSIATTLESLAVPARTEDLSPESHTLLWVYMQAWALLFGTVTLEVFGHCDPRVIRSGALFRAMLRNQAQLLGLDKEFGRLGPEIEEALRPRSDADRV